MSDWTIVVTTLGASGITGLVGYASAKWQGNVALDQARMENERLEAQHREDHLRNRQATYHDFLDYAATWERIATTTRQIFGEDEPNEEARARGEEADRRFRHLLNGVLLFGTEPVRQAARELERIQTQITAEWWARIDGERVRRRQQGPDAQRRPEPVGFAFPIERREEWEAALERLIDAMRADVAPV